MGTISEKLTYLNDTKSLLKDSINSLGGEITSQTTFRQYATELDSIYASLPKVSRSGSNISLSPTRKGRITSTLKGNTFQQTYTGKNLFNKNSTPNFVDNGCTYEILNTGIRSKLTATSDGTKQVRFVVCPLTGLENTKITAYANIKPSNNQNTRMTIGTCNSTGGNRNALIQGDFVNTQTIQAITGTIPSTLDSTNNYLYIILYATTATGIVSGAYIDFEDLMIVKGEYTTSTIGSYEPYTGGTASPNPSYPQNIESVTGLQNINVCGKNLLDISYYAQGSIDANTGQNISNSQNGRGNNYISVQPNTTYTISTKNNVSQLRLSEYTNEKVNIQRDSVINNKVLTITTTENTYYLRWSFNYDNVSTVTETIVNGLDLQLEKGSTATTYEAYQSQTKQLNLGKNLFDKNNANSINAYIDSGSNAIYTNENNKLLYIPIIGGKTYTVSKVKSDRFTIATTSVVPSNNVSTLNFLQDNNATSLTITAPSNAKYLAVHYYRSSDTLTPQQILDSIQIEVGSQATTYSPYFTPIHLYENDQIIGTPNNWSIKHVMGEVVLDGSETWNYQYTNGWNCDIPNLKQTTTNSEQPYCISNYYTKNSANSVYSSMSYGITQRPNYSAIIIKNVDMASSDALKAWLSTHNTKVVYELAEPTTEPITNQEIINQLNEIYYLMSYNGQTNISVQGDLQMILDVSALKGE